MVLDLAGVKVVDSIGVGSLIKIHKRAKKEGRDFILKGLSSDLFEARFHGHHLLFWDLRQLVHLLRL